MAVGEVAMAQPRIGIALIIYGKRASEDLPGVLREIGHAGYEGVEHVNLRRMDVRAKELLAENGLAVASLHCFFRDVASESGMEAGIAYLKDMGARYLICSGVAPGEGLERFEQAAPVFNAAGRRCREEGLVFCYHNHEWEFQAFDGVKGIHRLAELTDAALVKLCVDVYWVHIGGENPAEFIARYADRVPYLHFKDGAPGVFKELGQGEVDLKAATAAALAANGEWIVYEQDRTDKVALQAIAESRAYLRDELGL